MWMMIIIEMMVTKTMIILPLTALTAKKKKMTGSVMNCVSGYISYVTKLNQTYTRITEECALVSALTSRDQIMIIIRSLSNSETVSAKQ